MRVSVLTTVSSTYDTGGNAFGFIPKVVKGMRVLAGRESVPARRGAKRFSSAALVYAALCGIAASALWRMDAPLLISAPAIPLLIVALTAALAFACGGQAYVHERFSTHDFVQHNEVGGFMIAVAGTLYAVLLGFLTVVAWQHFADSRQLVTQEAAAATDAWHAAIGMPPGQRRRVREDALRYANVMLEDEWPQMRTGKFDAQADLVVMDAMTSAGAFKPADLMQSNAQIATQQQLSTLHDVRLRRLSENASAISGFEWLVLVGGAACIICFCWLFGLANRRVHLAMTAAVTILSVSVLVLLFELQYPFRSDLRIAPDSWTAAVDHIHMMQFGSQPNMRM